MLVTGIANALYESLPAPELSVLAAAAKSALTADEIVERTQIPAKRVLSALTMLQVQGAVEEQPGRRFYALVELEA